MLTPRSKGRSPPICFKGPESLHQDECKFGQCTDAQSPDVADPFAAGQLHEASSASPSLANHFFMFILLDLLNLDLKNAGDLTEQGIV